jgi:hypothetical protein
MEQLHQYNTSIRHYYVHSFELARSYVPSIEAGRNTCTNPVLLCEDLPLRQTPCSCILWRIITLEL